MPRKDFSQIAFDVVQQATGDVLPPSARKIASKKGGLKGGKTRMDALTPEQRSELAKKAAAARWGIAAPAVEASAAKGRLAKQS
jgi:hypothetical protein